MSEKRIDNGQWIIDNEEVVTLSEAKSPFVLPEKQNCLEQDYGD